jgi:hypothetical protein
VILFRWKRVYSAITSRKVCFVGTLRQLDLLLGSVSANHVSLIHFVPQVYANNLPYSDVKYNVVEVLLKLGQGRGKLRNLA